MTDDALSRLDDNRIAGENQRTEQTHERRYDALSDRLDTDDRRAPDPDTLVEQVQQFGTAVPSWALAAGGTRFGRFPVEGEPRGVYEKMNDIAVIHRLTRGAPRVSLHIPWDEPDDPARLRAHADEVGLGFDAMNSNTFEDQPEARQEHSYKFGSLCHTDAAVRRQAVEHNRRVIEIGDALGAEAITIWLADGANYPGQMHLRKGFERTRDSLAEIYDALPQNWRLFTEHKPYEPAFYATVVADWGSSLMLAQALGEQAQCLVDLGHHLPNTNIEQVVARLVTAGKLGGFHFNDSKYGDDDLTTGSIHPYQLFLSFNELVDAERDDAVDHFRPAYMIDQSHNVKDPIEALVQSVQQMQRAYARALLVDREALAHYRQENDVLMAERTLKDAYETDVRPLCAEARRRNGGALDPVAAFRNSGYRAAVAEARTGKDEPALV